MAACANAAASCSRGPKFTTPGLAIAAADVELHGLRRRIPGPSGVEQASAKQPGRLQRHAHALADDRVRLARRIADAERPVPCVHTDSGLQRAGREPGPIAGRRLQRATHTATLAPEECLNGLAGAQSG